MIMKEIKRIEMAACFSANWEMAAQSESTSRLYGALESAATNWWS